MKKNIGKEWWTDAAQIDRNVDYNEYVYRNTLINSFLENGQFLIAGKGIGKTLLLTYKRLLIQEIYRKNNQLASITFATSDGSRVDFMGEIEVTLSEAKISFLEDWNNCKKLWIFTIELSALSHWSIELAELIDNLPKRAKRYSAHFQHLLHEKRTVVYVFFYLIRLGETDLIKFLEECSYIVNESFRGINSSIYFFFDRLDQALGSSYPEIWCSLQIGLIEAAWVIKQINEHVKFFLSIRYEAYASYSSDNKLAMSSAVTILKYEGFELRNLLNHLVSFFEVDKHDIYDFLGTKTVFNATVQSNEDVFNFMRRYSVGRPRDFVAFCKYLSELINNKEIPYNPADDLGQKIKDTVIDTSSQWIIQNIHPEIKMLLHSLKTKEQFDSFVVLLETNVLKYSELKSICKKFNKSNCKGKCADCSSEFHPFCDLYNMGLLGKVEKPNGSSLVQKFKAPYEDMIEGLRGEYDCFIIHPALRGYINNRHDKTKKGKQYLLSPDLLIGDGEPWTMKDSIIAQLNKAIYKIRNDRLGDYFSDERHKFAFNSDYIFEQELYNEIIAANPVSQTDLKYSQKAIKLLSTSKHIKISTKESLMETHQLQSEESKNTRMIPMPLFSYMGNANATRVFCGTCFSIRYRGKPWLITCNHVIKEKLSVLYKAGMYVKVTNLSKKEDDTTDSAADISLLKLEKDDTSTNQEINMFSSNISDCSGWRALGFSTKHSQSIQILQGFSDVNSSGRSGLLEVSIKTIVENGFSGSPVININNELVGMVEGAFDNEKLYIIPTKYILEKIDSYLEDK